MDVGIEWCVLDCVAILLADYPQVTMEDNICYVHVVDISL